MKTNVDSIIYNCGKNIKVKGGKLVIEDKEGEIHMKSLAELICKGEYNYCG